MPYYAIIFLSYLLATEYIKTEELEKSCKAKPEIIFNQEEKP
jgi:hypothetical protein